MASTSELSLATRAFLRAYSWRRIDPVPRAALRRPLAQSSVAIVSTAGMVLPGQPPFDDSVAGGDWSWREIPADADVRSLIDTHRSGTYDHAGVRSDPNLAFPLDRLRELAAEGTIGSVAPRHFSFMGSITAPGRLVARSAPEVAAALVGSGAEAVVLVPV